MANPKSVEALDLADYAKHLRAAGGFSAAKVCLGIRAAAGLQFSGAFSRRTAVSAGLRTHGRTPPRGLA